MVAQIWLGKQLLEQRDKTEERQEIDITHSHVFIAQWGTASGEAGSRVAPREGEDVIEGELDPTSVED